MNQLRLLTEADIQTLTHDQAQAEYARLMQDMRKSVGALLGDAGWFGSRYLYARSFGYHEALGARGLARKMQKQATDIADAMEQITALWHRIEEES